MHVLTIDYRSPDASSRFSQSLKETGFAVLTHHPVSTNLISDVYHAWKNFFATDEQAKREYHYVKPSQAGYFPFRTENAKGSKASDLKEFFQFYLSGPVPKEMHALTLQMYESLSKLSAELLHWIEKHLPANISAKLSMPLQKMIVDSPKTMLRILHYPPLTTEFEAGAVRAAPHEDINLITLLPAATAPGLEVLDTKNNWHQVTCDPGNIVINVGDMLQMCTEHYYKSTTHRVINPDGDAMKESRYSMPLFLHPREEVKLSAEYTAESYLTERLRQIGIY